MGDRFHRTSSPSPTNGAVLRVKRVKVEGLFGLYNHDIPLNAEERVTIIHGPNGVGKTVLLRLIAAVFGGAYRTLAKVRFTMFEVEFSNDTSLTFEFFPSFDLDEIGLKVSLIAGATTLYSQHFPDAENVIRADDHRRRQPARRRQVFANRASADPPNVEPLWLEDLRKSLLVHLIETERLVKADVPDPEDGSPTLIPTVREIASDLHAGIAEALSRYAIESQFIDQSFPKRLLETKREVSISSHELEKRITTLNDTRARLEKIGLLDTATSSPFEIESMAASDPVQSNVIALYIDDAQQKLGVLDDIARRITLLLDNVNGKFRNKSIQISREEGFVVRGHDGAPIEPDSLSSGEQHELVQLYDLLFRVKPGTLVLIDEPELSLHVLWQKKYLSELLEIAKMAEFDTIVATHSPFIAGDRSDLLVALAADIDT